MNDSRIPPVFTRIDKGNSQEIDEDDQEVLLLNDKGSIIFSKMI